MKKSLKLLAGLFASVMLLSGAVSVAYAADTDGAAMPVAPTPGFPVSSFNPYLPYNGFYMPFLNGLTTEQWKEMYGSYYWSVLYPSYSGNIVLTPGLATYYKDSIELEQFSTYNLGFGAGVTYVSTDPSVVAVNPYGYVYANAAGTATISVSNEQRTFAFITITVKALDPDVVTNLEIVTRLASPRIVVGQSTTLYAYVTINGAAYPWHAFPYELEYTIADESIISFDEETGTITGLKKGTGDIRVSIKDSSVYTDVSIYVLETPTAAPSRPGTWFPIIGGSNGFINNGWTVTIPGYGTIGGIIPGFSYNWGFIAGFDSTKYDFEYRPVYADGKWTLAVVPVLKEDVTEEKAEEEKAPEKPAVPELTPEEKEKLEKEAAAAKKLAELKEKIAQAKEGKTAWYNVYSDIDAEPYYYNGTAYVLNKDLLAGSEDGTFGSKTVMTFGDLTDLFCKYLDLTKDELAAKKIIPAASAKKELTREDLAVAFYNLAKELELALYETVDLRTYKDYNDIDADARDAFAWAAANYIFDITTTEVDADAVVTKVQLARSIYLLDRMAD